ncbi:MAG TPA: hypothetical protein PLS07_04870 [Niabella sp.]|nr:hypothetical protein [Niabella sp.]HRB87090.1 hypothetical protein [Bacteroidia bacterium]HQX21582.1 hypothetical protein [Niabella sp.]HQX42774.1 hypothetical protein [Niabella sp.]HRB37202.1 hypothetical protein [Niabella sp.]
MAFWDRNKNSQGLRVIKTARDMGSINKAAKSGLYPLIKEVKPSDKIRSKYSVAQHKLTGEIKILGDYRWNDLEEYEVVIDWTFFYPYSFKSPFAAYLIPKDIKIGDRVFIEDLIEDYIGASWNQGDTYRLESCEAIWNGTDLEIQYDPKTNRSDFIG